MSEMTNPHDLLWYSSAMLLTFDRLCTSGIGALAQRSWLRDDCLLLMPLDYIPEGEMMTGKGARERLHLHLFGVGS